ncbi:MAG TPA: nucleotide exchange factor GrpE [Steroidobacteraceae bacterium]|nr:nucleotide exchange factor GrpE [Steroidobacteraceae bacterium]
MGSGEAEDLASGMDRLDPAEAARVAELERLLAEAEQRAAAQRDQYLRSLAEIDNVRKRAARDVENASRFGLEKFAVELLPVQDSLEAGVESAPRADAKSLAEGQRATLKLLQKAFEKLNIKPVDPLGQPFDPALHEAVLTQESATAEPNSVLQVVQRGYELNGRLLRPARVIVARAPANP